MAAALAALLGLIAATAHAQVCGDADGNGSVTVTDGVQVLRAAAGLSTSCTVARCDVDANGQSTVTDGVLVLRKAASLPVNERCLAGATDPLSVGTRQFIGNNPFGDLTKNPLVVTSSATPHIQLATRYSRLMSGRTARAPAEIDFTEPCQLGGTVAFTCEERSEPDGSVTTVGTEMRDRCTISTNDGGSRVSIGVQRNTTSDSAICTPNYPFDSRKESFEERFPKVFEFFDASGALYERIRDDSVVFVTYLDECVDSHGNSFRSEQSRGLTGTFETLLIADEGEVRYTQIFDNVTERIERSAAPSCEPTFILEGGSVRTVDGRLGEEFTTSFGGNVEHLRYRLVGGKLQVAGGLTSTCGGAQTTFAYRTIEAPTLDPSAPDSCPRNGTIEISSDGTILGQATFTGTGGVQLRAASGASTFFANCNDAGLLLRCE